MSEIQEAIEELKMENALLGVINPMKVKRNNLAIVALQLQAEREKRPQNFYDEIRSMTIVEIASLLSGAFYGDGYEDGDYAPDIMEMLKKPSKKAGEPE